jgi:hypothetical protein
MNTCHNCGLTEWAVTGDGQEVVIQEKPENRFQKSRKRTVWVCGEECSIQTQAISKYGPASSKWPVTLAQFRSLVRKRALRGSE